MKKVIDITEKANAYFELCQHTQKMGICGLMLQGYTRDAAEEELDRIAEEEKRDEERLTGRRKHISIKTMFPVWRFRRATQQAP